MMKNRRENSTKSEFIHVFISLPTGEVCTLRDVCTKLLVQQIKAKIELRVGIPGDLIHLYFMNKLLADDKSLRDYELRQGCILRVRLHKIWLGLYLACSKGDSYEVFQNGVQEIEDKNAMDFDVELWNKLVGKRATFALFMATFHGYLSLMLDLLNSTSADINGCTVFGRSALHIASFQGFVGCVSLLLSEGCTPGALDVFGKTPLQLASINKHIYCQKRIYMHQHSSEGGTDGESHNNAQRKTAPHDLVKNFHKHQRMRNDVSSRSAGAASCEEMSDENLPSFANPGMSLDECSKSHHISRDVPSQSSAPTLRAQTAPVSRSGLRAQPRTSYGLHGIDAILKNAQEDIVGEYHNIDESIIDVNMTTLKLTLPSAESLPTSSQTRQPGLVNSSAHDEHFIQAEISTRISHGKKMLRFVLKAEENRNSNERSNSTLSEKFEEQHDNPSSEPRPKNEKLWMTSFDDHPGQNECLDSQLWSPKASESPDRHQEAARQFWIPQSVPQNHSDHAHRKLGLSLSYDAWLTKKRRLQQQAKIERPDSEAGLKSKVGQTMDVAAFQQWIDGKKKLRKRNKSESFTVENHRACSGVPFDEWLREKRKQLNESTLEASSTQATENCEHRRQKEAFLGGKTFSEWLAEKTKTYQMPDENLKIDSQRNRAQSGKTFQEWLTEKNKAQQIEALSQKKLAILELEKKALAAKQRRLNPRVKTFQKWSEEKRTQNIIEFIQSKNVPSDELFDSNLKYHEDACLVYDIWLTAKNMESLAREERLYEEMVDKWQRKEHERLQMRTNVLNRFSQTKKDR